MAVAFAGQPVHVCAEGARAPVFVVRNLRFRTKASTAKRSGSVDSRLVNEAWLDELAEFIRIPSVSADPAHRDDVARAAEWVADYVRAAGGSAELVPTDKQPLMIGELPASNGADAPTVLVY